MITTEERLQMFSNELNEIKDAKLKEFAKEILTKADDYFFTMPASTTGKYHPAYTLGNGGLARHTRAVVYFSRALGTAKMYDDYTLDMLSVAAIAHDIKKKGEKGSKYTTKDHPECAAAYLTKLYESDNSYMTAENFEVLKNGVISHMGQWGTTKPATDFEFTLHCADYLASRKEVDYNMPVTETTVLNESSTEDENPQRLENQVNPNWKIPFGKYIDKTLDQVYEENKQYLEWISSYEGFNNKEIQSLVSEYLQSKTNKSSE